MTTISQSAEVVFPSAYEELALLQLVETAGKIRYNYKPGRDSCFRYITKMIQRQHFSVLEFYDIVLELMTTRDVMEELIRRQSFSFAIPPQWRDGSVDETEINIVRPINKAIVKTYLKGNLRQWLLLFAQSMFEVTSPETQALMRLMLEAVRKELPRTYDIVFAPYYE
jgi:thymidylate synthase ThyX